MTLSLDQLGLRSIVVICFRIVNQLTVSAENIFNFEDRSFESMMEMECKDGRSKSQRHRRDLLESKNVLKFK